MLNNYDDVKELTSTYTIFANTYNKLMVDKSSSTIL